MNSPIRIVPEASQEAVRLAMVAQLEDIIARIKTGEIVEYSMFMVFHGSSVGTAHSPMASKTEHIGRLFRVMCDLDKGIGNL
jgi:hypothetical protein